MTFQAKWSDLLKLLGPGFERPSAVQQRAILPILKGRDVIVQSQSGTGRLGVQGAMGPQRLRLQVEFHTPQ